MNEKRNITDEMTPRASAPATDAPAPARRNESKDVPSTHYRNSRGDKEGFRAPASKERPSTHFAARKPALLAAVLVALVAVLLSAAIASAETAVPDNPAEGFDNSASQVAWTGEGYSAPTDEGADEDEPDEPPVVELPPEPLPPDDPENEPDAESETADVESDADEGGPTVEGDGGRAVEGSDGSPTPNGDTPDPAPSGEASPPVDDPDQEPEPDPDPDPEPDEDPEPGPDGETDEPNNVEFEDGEDPFDDQREDDADDTEDAEGAQAPEPDPEADPNEGKYPEIETDLEDGEVIGQDWRTFHVRATDYKGRTLDTSRVRVTADDGSGASRLYATGDDGYEITYRLDVTAPDVDVTIRAEDSKGRATVVELTVHRSDEDAAPVSDGFVTISVEANTVGLGTLLGPEEFEIYQGEALPEVLERALSENGFGMVYKGSLSKGFHLQHITRPGITDGCEIPAKLLEHLEEVGYTPGDYYQDSLGEYDFSGSSGWTYMVNDVYMSQGMASYYPADGDEVRLRFTLYYGSDVGGDSGPQWEEEW